MEKIQLDPERQKQAREYARIQRRLSLLGMGLSGVYALAWLVFGWENSLLVGLLQFTANLWAVVALYAVIFGGVYGLVTLPLDFYIGFT